jgi:hypothetical protein
MYEINAEGFIHNAKTYTEEFRYLLVGIVSCYNMMIKDNIKVLNDENEIRDRILRDYLNNDDIRKSIELTEFAFNPEVQEKDSKGNVDIKIEIKNPLRSVAPYYIIECKRLDGRNILGVSGLNGEYIKNGICRFADGKYSTHCGINGLIGFVVTELDIGANTEHINTLAKTKINCNMIREIQKEYFIPNFDYHYSSDHKDCKNNTFTLYHLMLDFSSNIEKPSGVYDTEKNPECTTLPRSTPK